ncbi:MAG: GumC family protein, partial [Hyphomicrobiales bacterium]|nr:GumC family protein [Hyphomicrobiales bacterium]
MAGHTDLSRDVDIDIVGLFSNIWRKKWVILVLSAMVGACIYIVMSSISPRYQTTAQLIIEPRESEFTRVREPSSSGIDANEFDAAAVLSQVQIISSDSIALGTIKKQNLATSPEFGDNVEPSMLSDLFVLTGLKNESLAIPPEERVLKEFKSRLKAYSIENSRVIEISFWANDRQLAKKITNTIADEYLLAQRDSKLEAGANATKFLEPEIANLREKVRLAEVRVAEFRSSSDILLGNNNSLLATQQLSEVSTELSRIRAQRSAAEAKIESIRSSIKVGSSLEAIPEVIASPLIQRLRERQVQLRAQISELSITLLPAHPRLKSLKSQLKDFENQIRREARGILASLENNVKILRNQESSLVEELTRLKAESARAGEAEVELRALERDAVSERELLQAYLSKYQEAAGRQSSKYLPVNARIISWAHLPAESYYPKTIPYSIAGTLVTAILSMVGVLVVSLLNGKAFRKVEDSGVPVGHKTIEETPEKIHIPVQPDEAVVPGLQSVSEKQQIVSDPVELRNPDIRVSQADMPELIASPPQNRTGQKTNTLPPQNRTGQKADALPPQNRTGQNTDALPPQNRTGQNTDALPPQNRTGQNTDALPP